MSNAIATVSATGVSIVPVGESKADRQFSVLNSATSTTVSAMCAGKGKAAKAAQQLTAQNAMVDIARQAAWPYNNYRAFAEYVSATLGTPVTISNRAGFESFPDRMRDLVEAIKNGKTPKSGNPAGFVTDKKTGGLKAGAKLAEAMALHAFAVNVLRASQEISAHNKAKHEADKQAEARQLANEATA